ncbi:MAG TPA: iron-sulfur cluster assembly protein [Solirubrobacteraceae bacterium]|jgi:metal-sulfur cluster biosynthetic enzyme|nr:iron-sulfur cluster assembly protein [Solirubrobacteraceae bacterium]
MSGSASPPSEAESRPTRAPAAASAADGAGLREQVLDALGTVYDPELDEPITSLRFITSCRVTAEGDVDVVLRLPTPQCAPNFAFLMAADARRAAGSVTGVRGVSIALEDHYTGEEINRALARGQGFTGAFPGETEDDDLEALRELFIRKALIGRQARLCERMLDNGASEQEVVSATVSQLPTGDADANRVLELRVQLGFSAAPDAPAFIQPNGEPVAVDQLRRWLRAGRLVRTGLEANGGMCRSLLAFRHNLDSETQEVGR